MAHRLMVTKGWGGRGETASQVRGLLWEDGNVLKPEGAGGAQPPLVHLECTTCNCTVHFIMVTLL